MHLEFYAVVKEFIEYNRKYFSDKQTEFIVRELDIANRRVWLGHKHTERDGCDDWVECDYFSFDEIELYQITPDGVHIKIN